MLRLRSVRLRGSVCVTLGLLASMAVVSCLNEPDVPDGGSSDSGEGGAGSSVDATFDVLAFEGGSVDADTVSDGSDARDALTRDAADVDDASEDASSDDASDDASADASEDASLDAAAPDASKDASVDPGRKPCSPCALGTGPCEATSPELTSAPNMVWLNVDARNIYGVRGGDAIWRVDKATYTPAPLATGQAGATYLTSDGAYLYWFTSAGALARAAKDGTGSVDVLYTGLTSGTLVVLGENLYWYASNQIWGAPKAGGGTPTAVSALSGLATPDLVTNGTHLYGRSNGSTMVIWRWRPGTTSTDGSFGLAANFKFNSLVGSADGVVFGTMRTFLTAPPEFSFQSWYGPAWSGPKYPDYVYPVTFDRCGLYYVTNSTWLYERTKSSGPRFIAGGPGRSSAYFAMDDTYLYYVGASALVRLARP